MVYFFFLKITINQLLITDCQKEKLAKDTEQLSNDRKQFEIDKEKLSNDREQFEIDKRKLMNHDYVLIQRDIWIQRQSNNDNKK